MKYLNSKRFFQLTMFFFISAVTSISHANTILNTYQISTVFYNSSLNDNMTFSFDVTTNDGCTSCGLSDLVSTTPTNLSLLLSSQTFSGPLSYSNGDSTLTSFSMDTTSYCSGCDQLVTLPSNISYTQSLQFLDMANHATDVSADNSTVDLVGAYMFYSVSSSVTLVNGPCSPVPLPPSLALFGSGLLGLGAVRRKGKARNP